MAKRLITLVASMVLAAPRLAQPISPTREDNEELRSWVAARFAADAARPPFSFDYDNRSFGMILKAWRAQRSERQLDERRVRRVLVHTDPATSLAVRCETTEYSDYPAIEWVLHFENTGDRDTPILTNVHAADLTLSGAGGVPGAPYGMNERQVIGFEGDKRDARI